MQKAIDYMASKGIGMIHTVSGVGFVRDLDVDLERWFGRGLNNGMQLRVFFQTMDVKKVQKRHLTRVGCRFLFKILINFPGLQLTAPPSLL